MNEQTKQRMIDVLKIQKTSHLATADANGPTVRVMSVAQVEDDGTVWYASGADSDKVRQIQAQPKVAVSAYDGRTTLEMTGAATIVTDTETKRKMWHDTWAPYFPGGQDDPNYVLIKITPAEVKVY